MIDLRGVTLASPDGPPPFRDLDLQVAGGGAMLLAGPSGCGKSRLLKVMAGVERPAAGEVRVGGVRIWPGSGAFALMGRVSVGFAFAGGGLLANHTLFDNAALPLRVRGCSEAEVRSRVGAAFERLGLQAVMELRPHAVSASARKHANLARVMALAPEVVLADDPLEGLDPQDRSAALDVISDWCVAGRTALVVATEDPDAFYSLPLFRYDLPVPPTRQELP